MGPEAEAHVALLHFHQNRLEQAIEAATRAAQRAADPAIQNLALVIQGMAFASRGDQRRAMESYRAAHTVLPGARTSATALANYLFFGWTTL